MAYRRADSLRQKDRLQGVIRSFKEVPCADCKGEFPHYCMEFDHVYGTGTRIAFGWRTWGLERLILEVSKCDIVCANCHSARTYLRTHPK